MLDALTDALFPVVDDLEQRIDALEERVLRDTDRHQLGEIYRLKQEVQLLLRRIVPQRDQFGAATEAIMALPGLTRGSREYLRDIGDHLAQVTGELYRQADDLATLTSTYFNANQNRLNRLATRLTVLGTFFLIWTLVTSFFGQNFGWLTDHIDSFEAFLLYDDDRARHPDRAGGDLLLAEAARMAVTPRPERLAPDVFRLPVERIRGGYYSDAYFNYTKELLEDEGRDPHVLMQVFQRNESILGGIDEAIAVLEQCSGRRLPDGGWEDGWDRLDVRALREGDAIAPWETVMTIEGPYSAVRPPRDGLPRHARAAHADHAQRRGGGRGGARQADPLLPRAPRPLARADRRRLGGARGRRDRRVDRRPGLLVGRPRRGDGAARAHRGLRRRHRGGRARRSRGATRTR